MQNILKKSLSIVCFTLVLSPICSWANPLGGKVAAGQASIDNSQKNQTIINQATDRAVIDWDSFNIGAKETTRFVQPSSSSATLNRIHSGSPSEILGNLNANGRIYLVNPDGFVFGSGAKIDTSGFMATTNDIANEDFMNGILHFSEVGNTDAKIVNNGAISVANLGFAALVAPMVENNGVIAGRFAKIGLASGGAFDLDLYGDNLVNFEVSPETIASLYSPEGGSMAESGVYNNGKISADGGMVLLRADQIPGIVNSVVSNDGIVEARTISAREGRVGFWAGRDLDSKVSNTGTVDVSGFSESDNAGSFSTEAKEVVVSGSINAKGKKGGDVYLMGEAVRLVGSMIDASGCGDGGTVLVGGDYLGGRASQETYEKLGISREVLGFDNARYVFFDENSKVLADSTVDGSGGKIVFWADENTYAYGDAYSRALGGKGGFVEASGRESLDVLGLDLDVTSSEGNNGSVLFDPKFVIIGDWGLGAERVELLDDGVLVLPERGVVPTFIPASQIESYLNMGINVNLYSDDPNSTVRLDDSIYKTAGGDSTLSITAGWIEMGVSDVYDNGRDAFNIISSSNKLNISLNESNSYHESIYFDRIKIDTNGGYLDLNGKGIIINETYAYALPSGGIAITSVVRNEYDAPKSAGYRKRMDIDEYRVKIKAIVVNSNLNSNDPPLLESDDEEVGNEVDRKEAEYSQTEKDPYYEPYVDEPNEGRSKMEDSAIDYLTWRAGMTSDEARELADLYGHIQDAAYIESHAEQRGDSVAQGVPDLKIGAMSLRDIVQLYAENKFYNDLRYNEMARLNELINEGTEGWSSDLLSNAKIQKAKSLNNELDALTDAYNNVKVESKNPFEYSWLSLKQALVTVVNTPGDIMTLFVGKDGYKYSDLAKNLDPEAAKITAELLVDTVQIFRSVFDMGTSGLSENEFSGEKGMLTLIDTVLNRIEKTKILQKVTALAEIKTSLEELSKNLKGYEKLGTVKEDVPGLAYMISEYHYQTEIISLAVGVLGNVVPDAVPGISERVSAALNIVSEGAKSTYQNERSLLKVAEAYDKAVSLQKDYVEVKRDQYKDYIDGVGEVVADSNNWGALESANYSF